jgi:protein SCO1/2
VTGAVPILAQPAMPSSVREVGIASQTLPNPLKSVGYDQRLGASMPMSAILRDESGKAVRLGDLFRGRPVVFALAYYSCPMLCNVVLDDLAAGLKVISFNAGQDFDVVVVSFDPLDTAKLAAAKKASILARYGRPKTAPAWHFLTGDATAIAAVTQAVGFRYYFDEETRQYAHAAGAVLLTPTGRISRYFYGIEFPPRDLRLGLVEASGDKIGTVVDQVLLYCFHYNPVVGKYSAVTMNIVRLGGAVTVVGLLLLVLLLRRRESVLLGRA